jgi:multisubunit Na+/H+ antiporter MnhC subunit
VIQGTALVVRNREFTSLAILVTLGAAFLLVGLADLALLWWPIEFGNPAWEFGTISQTFDSLPMSGLGFGLIVFGLTRYSNTPAVVMRGLAGFTTVVTVVLLGLGAIWATSVPPVARRTPEPALDGLGMAIVKNVAEIVIYTAAFAVMTVLLWRGVKRSREVRDA